MTAIPTADNFNNPSTTQQQFQAALTQLLNYLTGLLGSDGVPSTARITLGVTTFNPRGAWSSSNAYAQYDWVTYNGGTYVAKAAVGPSATPPNSDTANWLDTATYDPNVEAALAYTAAGAATTAQNAAASVVNGVYYPNPNTLAGLNANLNFAAGVGARVLADTTLANNGYYVKVGASGTGSWNYIGADATATEAGIRAAADTEEANLRATSDSAIHGVLDPIAAALPSGYTNRSGWVWARVDSAKRILRGIDRSGTGQSYIPEVFRNTVNFLSSVTTSQLTLGDGTRNYLSGYQRSPYVAATVDAAKRVLWGWRKFDRLYQWFVDVAFYGRVIISGPSTFLQPPTLPGAQLGSQPVTYGNYAGFRSGYLWSRVDSALRVLIGQKLDGSVWAAGKRLVNTADIANFVTATPASQYDVYQALDQSGRSQIYSAARATGIIKQLSASGSNNTIPRLSSDASYVLYQTDRSSGPPRGVMAAPIGGGAERIALPVLGRMTAIGDSLTFGQGATNPSTDPYPAQIAAAQGWTVTNLGMPGFTSTSMAAYVGAIPTTVTVAGNSIAGNGATTPITAISPYPLSTHNGTSSTDGGTRTLTGTLAGVHGTLRRTPNGSPGSYTDLYQFTSDVGTATTSCPAGSVFVPDTQGRDNEVLGICLGTNTDGDSTATIESNVAAIINWAKPLFKRILLYGLPAASGLNSYWRTAWPLYYTVDSLNRDLHQRMLASGNGSTQDNADIAADLVPTSLVDPVSGRPHLNSAGYAVWGAFSNEIISTRGYNL